MTLHLWLPLYLPTTCDNVFKRYAILVLATVVVVTGGGGGNYVGVAISDLY